MTKTHIDRLIRSYPPKDRDNLNNALFIEGSDYDYVPAVMLEDLSYMKIDTTICESVFNTDIFNDIFKHLKDDNRTFDIFSSSDIANFFPLKSNIFKAFHNRRLPFLYVLKCEFNEHDIFDSLKSISSAKLTDDMIMKKTNEIMSNISINTDGIFAYFENVDLFGMIFLRYDFSIETLKHEFIHFFNWSKKKYQFSMSADTKTYENEFNMIRRFINNDFSERNFEYVTTDNEYETLLNDFLDQLSMVKKKYYGDMDNYDFAKMICKDIMIDRSVNEIVNKEDYLKHLTTLKYFNDLKNKNQFMMIVIFNLLDYKLMNIKNHIFGKFKKLMRFNECIERFLNEC